MLQLHGTMGDMKYIRKVGVRSGSSNETCKVTVNNILKRAQ